MKEQSPVPSEASKHVVIIGAGIVGVATALWLQRDGHQVTLIDREGPAAGASFGNGGVLAASSIVPVSGPGLIAKAPRMALDPREPLYLRWGYLPKLAPWLWRFLAHANRDDATQISAGLAPLTLDSLADHQALAAGTTAQKWIVPCDYLYLYADRKAYGADSFGWELRRQQGVQWQEIEGPALQAYDPVFSPSLGFAACMGEHGRIQDPGRYIKDLAAHLTAQGGALRRAEVQGIATDNGRVVGVRAGGETVACDAAVIATGAWSGPLCRQLGLKVPLESERGYHLELWEPNQTPRSPVMVAAGKFVITPMEGRLRLAGIVEFGGLEAKPSQAPLRLLEKHVRAAIPGLRWGETTSWLGHRPAITDSLPLIGPVPGISGAYVGFGHHHVGLTAGPRTGRLLAHLISERLPNIDLAPYSPTRFQ